jgi:hypothetical protein
MTPRKSKKLRVLGESDGEFTRQSSEAEEEEESDAGFVDPTELAQAKARSGGRGMTQTSPAAKSPSKSPAKSPAKILPLKGEKKSSSVQANAIPKKNAKQTQSPKKAVKPDQPPKKAVKPDQPPKKAVKPDQPPKKAVKPDQPPKSAVKIGRPPENAVKPGQSLKNAVRSARPPKNAVKQNPAPKSPAVKKPTVASSGTGSAGNPTVLDKKRDTAQGAPRKPKVVAAAARAPSIGSQVQAPSSETVSQKQASKKRYTSVRVVTVAPKVVGPEANPLGGASGKSLSLAKSAPKVAQQTTPMSNAVAGKRPCPVEPLPVRNAKRSKASAAPQSDSESTEYMSASEDA